MCCMMQASELLGERSAESGGTDGGVMPAPTEREWILRARAGRPHRHSRPSPHRLHAHLTKEDIAIAAAITQDKTFF